MLITLLLAACVVDLYVDDQDPRVHESENITITDADTHPDLPGHGATDEDPVPPITTDDTDATTVVVGDTDAPAVGDDTDVVHPTMDEFGNPLYPTLDPTFEETGVMPPDTVEGTLEDCNIPDDFMLVTYVDFDQDGFGTMPYTTGLGSGYDPLFLPFTASNISGSVDYYSDAYSLTDVFNMLQPQIRSEAPQPISRMTVSLFPEIFNQSTGAERFHAALEIINAEGGLTHDLTPQMAMTLFRKEFRDELVFVAQNRCANNVSCYNTQYHEFTLWNPSRFGFNSSIFLTYVLWGFPEGNGQYSHGSPYSAAFWQGDDGITFGYHYRSSMFDRPSDLDATINEGFYVCSWFGDDADSDGYTLAEGDCHDGAAWIHPGAVEIPNNGTDNNCDGMEECYGDHDGDGYPSLSAPTTLVNGVVCPQLRPDDCNDSNPNQNRGAVELPCNHIDENCDGQDM